MNSYISISELKQILSKYNDDDILRLYAGTSGGFGFGDVSIVSKDGLCCETIMEYEEDC